MNKTNLFNLGQNSFNLSIFFLISAPFLSVLFLVISLIISMIINGSSSIKNRWNYPVLLSFLILLLSCLRNTIFSNQGFIRNETLWIDVFNWLPLILIFIFIPIYISSNNQKILFSKLIIMGNIPLIFSCFLQKHLAIYGPFSFLNGLIIWYQRAPGETTISTTGLFNNPNYTGFALVIIVPFIIFNLLINKQNKKKKFLTILILASTIYTIYLTNSRNAYLGLFLSFLFTFGIKFLLLIAIIFLLLYFLNFALFNIFGIDALYIFINKFNFNIYNILSNLSFENLISSQRLEIWNKAINIISQKPILGWGASTFGYLYLVNGGLFGAQHAHNLILQVSQNYGVVFTFLIFGTVILIILKSLRILNSVKNKNNLINKFWIISLVIASLHQLFDVVLFDGRLNIVFCILIAGAKVLVSEDKFFNESKR